MPTINLRRIAQLHRELAEAYEEVYEPSAEDTGNWGMGDVPPDAPDDPWANDAPQSRPATAATTPQPQSRQGGPSTPTQGTFTDDRGKTWVFGKNGAKLCNGKDTHAPMPAALVSGVSEKTGKTWKAWACPLGYGATWRDKCDLYDFTR